MTTILFPAATRQAVIVFAISAALIQSPIQLTGQTPAAAIGPTLPPSPCSIEAQSSARTLDDSFADVARKVPEFGGMFYGSDGESLQVYLTQGSKEKVGRVQSAIAEVFGAEIGKRPIKPLKGRYGFLQLKEWYDRIQAPIFAISGVTLTDIDEVKNGIRIGVAEKKYQEQILEQIGKLKVPREAVSVEVTGPIKLLSTVQNAHSPRQGGYQITRLLCNTTGVGISACTLGFSVKSPCGGFGFVTNGHCTRFSWRLDIAPGCPPNDTDGGGCPGTVSIAVGCPANSCLPCNFYQAPGYFPSELVGAETFDPSGFTGGSCPSGQTCRWSETAFVTYNAGVSVEKGTIARTTGITTSISTPILTVSSNVPPPPPLPPTAFGPGKFGIVGPPSLPYLAGLLLNKVGRTTGWTQGTIQYTSVNTMFCDDQIPNRLLLSQYFVTHATNDVVDQGDSGSPVFRILKPGTRAELYGIVWGRTTNKTFIFSPIGGVPSQSGGVQTDLGQLDYVWP